MLRLRSIVMICLTIVTALAPSLTAADTTPVDTPLDLAAMALTSTDVPAGYFDDYSEGWLPAVIFADTYLGSEFDETPAIAPAGLLRVYTSGYVNDREGSSIRNYLFEFADEQSATDAFSGIETLLRPRYFPLVATTEPIVEPGPVIGNAQSSTTIASYNWDDSGTLIDLAATSFTRDTLIASTAVEQFVSDDAVAEAEPIPATQIDLAASLASTLGQRMTTVLDGGTPTGVDRSLAEWILPLDSVSADTSVIRGGYVAGIDLLRCGICGEGEALFPFADTARNGFTHGTLAFGPTPGGEIAPQIVIAIATFESPEDAQNVLAAIRDNPYLSPSPIFQIRTAHTLTTAPVIPGATDVLALLSPSITEDVNAPIDSASVNLVVDNLLIVVDVSWAADETAALATAVDLATRQVERIP